MADARAYPALVVSWPSPPSEADRDLLLATVDDDGPTAVEETPDGARVFFSSGEARERAAARVASTLPVTCHSIAVSDECWAERSQASLQPVSVGRLVITPRAEPRGSALQGSDDERDLTIVIRPSMGFGTGHHASTRLCLSLLQQLPLAGQSVLDVGTGSGVLAIAALKLHAASVRAIDNDADAIQSARENLDLNGVEDAIALLLCDLGELPPEPTADVITANLTGAHLEASAAAIGALAGPDGHLILGGLQTDEEADVRRAFEALGWMVDARVEEDGWTGLLLRRRP